MGDHPLVVQSLNNLADLLETQNKLAEAEPLYRRALDEREGVRRRSSGRGGLAQQPRGLALEAEQVRRGRAAAPPRARDQREGVRQRPSERGGLARQPRACSLG